MIDNSIIKHSKNSIMNLTFYIDLHQLDIHNPMEMWRCGSYKLNNYARSQDQVRLSQT